MRKHLLSLVKTLALSFCLTLGILVADLTNLHAAAAGAQAGAAAVADGTVVGHSIAARNVLVNGVATSGVFRGSVRIADSIVYGGGTNLTGIFPHVSEGVSAGGIFPHVSDSLSDDGIFPHTPDSLSAGGIFPHVTDTATGASLTGGVVEGDSVQVVDGVITGQNLRVVGTVVSVGRAASVVAGPGAPPAS
ncbi:MAG TPA: hypothetical protein VG148_13505 [Pyrinomonadaceae bacterium]|nr:hypothetical protein [Pyrinomonadaceae bacterium]